jgi:hypothetical protein
MRSSVWTSRPRERQRGYSCRARCFGLVAYAKGSISVGEIIVELNEEDGLFAVPAVCLIGAAQTVPDAHLGLLTKHPACRVLPLLAQDWSPLANAVRIFGRLDLAAALYAARRANGYVLTAEPEAYGDGSDAVIPV